jgi:hypothetical protein
MSLAVCGLIDDGDSAALHIRASVDVPTAGHHVVASVLIE